MQPECISTLDDPRLEDYAGVRDPVRLRQRGAFLAEGRLVLRTLLGQSRFTLRSLLLTPPALAWIEREGLCIPPGVPVFEVTAAVLEADAGHRFHQGCLAAADVPAAVSVDALCARAQTTAAPLVMLQGVSNPDNVGAILRTAAAFGCPGMILDAACASPLYRKAVRTSMGAALRVPFHHAGDSLALVQAVQGAQVEVLALTPEPGAQSIEAIADKRTARALLLGAEGEGLPSTLQATADLRVRIPMDPAIDSLNVAAAAAIALYRLGADSPPDLPK